MDVTVFVVVVVVVVVVDVVVVVCLSVAEIVLATASLVLSRLQKRKNGAQHKDKDEVLMCLGVQFVTICGFSLVTFRYAKGQKRLVVTPLELILLIPNSHDVYLSPCQITISSKVSISKKLVRKHISAILVTCCK